MCLQSGAEVGVETAIPDEVIGLETASDPDNGRFLKLATKEAVSARSVVMASGARYRQLAV